MKNKILAIALITPLICLAGWLIYLTFQRATGKEVIVSIQGYDPRDLLSGHYIRYTIDWEKTNCAQFENGLCPEEEFCKNARWGGLCRFYVPERNAQELDGLFWLRNDSDLIFEVIYSYKKGSEPIAKQMLINGEDWRKSLKGN